MARDRKQLLSESLAANHQRALARSFVANFSASMGSELANARVVVRPESDAITAFQCVYEDGIGIRNRVRPVDFVFAALSAPAQVVSALERFGDRLDTQMGYFRPAGYRPRELESHFAGETPIFEVNFGWARRHFAEFYAASRHQCGLTTLHGKAGIVTYVVCGYSDRHADEEVFELGYWGNLLNAPFTMSAGT